MCSSSARFDFTKGPSLFRMIQPPHLLDRVPVSKAPSTMSHHQTVPSASIVRWPQPGLSFGRTVKTSPPLTKVMILKFCQQLLFHNLCNPSSLPSPAPSPQSGHSS
ncbi:hypothetical protein NPIL_136761 [Nephila pilipes]|uniref:Uncharacterized protein n=1 Tax=Nephila pilipes TaxID=299642 RepID=A0A8X6TP54_NEPPI|nr:hypothetical protein NPIL_136761 [Nephila pilipes]